MDALLCTNFSSFSKALQCTLYHAEHFVFRNFSHGCPFQWPLLSMCSSSNSNTPKKTDTQRHHESHDTRSVVGPSGGSARVVLTLRVSWVHWGMGTQRSLTLGVSLVQVGNVPRQS